MKYLKTIRIIVAALVLLSLTALLFDYTGVLRHWFGWIPKMQFLPAILSLNIVIVISVVLVTFIIGRLYCSVICPLGIFQDIFTWFHKIIFPRKKFVYRKPSNWLRYSILVLFIILMVAGVNSIVSLVAPYSAYSRMVVNIHSSGVAQIVAIATLVIIGMCSFLYGRLWCNTICPVGSVLSIISRYSLFGIKIDKSKCVGCKRCEGACKAMCIDIEGGKNIDHSRCVNCFNCLGECKVGAISIGKNGCSKADNKQENEKIDSSRRKFMATTVAVGTAMAVKAQEQKVDGGLAVILDKKVPERKVPLKPAGSIGLKNFSSHCTACQLCVSQCPEKVLKPSSKIERFMQPEMDYTNGYCRQACTRCSDVCPTGAITLIDKEEKTSISIGRAIVIADNCISADGTNCGACARHCPAAAISMITDKDGRTIPSVMESKCIGCGACEYYCPARPQVAIYVEGKELHTEI